MEQRLLSALAEQSECSVCLLRIVCSHRSLSVGEETVEFAGSYPRRPRRRVGAAVVALRYFASQ